MDLLRGAAVLLIVVWHVFAVGPMLGGIEVHGVIGAVNAALSPFRIPTLLVLSGMLLERSLAKGPRLHVTGKLRHIAWPYVLWCLLIAVVSTPRPDLGSPWFWLGGNILWFLPVLLFCYAAALLRPTWLPWWTCVVVPLGVLWVVDPSTNAYIRFLWFGAFFFLGAALRSSVPMLQERLPRWGAALLAAVTVCGGIVVAQGLVAPQTPIFFLISTFGIITVLWAAPRVPDSSLTRLLEWYGRNSMIVYVGHAFAMFAAMSGMVAIGAEASVFVIPLLAIVGIAAPTLAILVRRRIDWLFVLPGRAGEQAARSDKAVRA